MFSISSQGIDVSGYLRKFERFRDLGLFRTVENGRHYLPTEFRRSSAEVDFKHLTDIHSGRNAERVKNDVERTTVFKERHIFLRAHQNFVDKRNAGNPVAVQHLSISLDVVLTAGEVPHEVAQYIKFSW